MWVLRHYSDSGLVCKAHGKRQTFTTDQESSIEAIQAMGYPRDQVIAALRAAYWNPDRAVEYLLSGIPDEEQMPIEVGGEEEESEGDQGFLTLSVLLQQRLFISESSSSSLSSCALHLPQMAMNFVSRTFSNPEILPSLIQPAAGAEAAANPNPYGERHVIDLTEQEAAAIQRIKSMGFRVPDGLIIEAYLACDKNDGNGHRFYNLTEVKCGPTEDDM
ncbi:UBA/TS-N domain protein [Ostertagia ostertagi]